MSKDETYYDMNALEPSILVGGQKIIAHAIGRCRGYWCPVHYNSNHHMDSWPQNWRSDRALMERICPHGIGHPDPDDQKSMDEFESVHGCDGCCARPYDIETELRIINNDK